MVCCGLCAWIELRLLLHTPPAIHGDDLPRDVLRRGKEEHRAGDVLRPAGPFQGDARQGLVLGVCVALGPEDGTRRHAIDADLRRQFPGQAFYHHGIGSLCHAVHRMVLVRAFRVDVHHVDDATAGFPQRARRFFRQKERCLGIDAEQAVPLLFRDLVHGGGKEIGSIVEQDIQLAGGFEGVIDKPGQIRKIQQVALHEGH